jgi:cell fate (sporulation/competence/biofilm development) regulator YlbF (YheA/YmcA/DUF963 family)
MATTADILAAAEKLGEQLAQHDAAKKLESALKALQSNVESQRVLNDYNRHLQSLGEKEAAGRPIEVEDKHKLESLQKAVIMNPLLRQFQTAQMDYVDLLRRVDDAMLGKSSVAAEAGLTAAGGGAESPLVAPGFAGR